MLESNSRAAELREERRPGAERKTNRLEEKTNSCCSLALQASSAFRRTLLFFVVSFYRISKRQNDKQQNHCQLHRGAFDPAGHL